MYPQDEEAGLSCPPAFGRATRRALESVRNGHGNLWIQPVREAVQLRVQLAGCGNWDEVREVMNTICGGTSFRHTLPAPSFLSPGDRQS